MYYLSCTFYNLLFEHFKIMLTHYSLGLVAVLLNGYRLHIGTIHIHCGPLSLTKNIHFLHGTSTESMSLNNFKFNL